MAVAVKNTPETSSTTLFDRLPVASVAGAVYVLGSIAVVLMWLPHVWWNILKLPRDNFAAVALLGLAMLMAAAVLVFVGGRLLAPRQLPGLRSGIFTAIVGLLVIGLFTRWIGVLLDGWIYSSRMFGDSGPTIGATITGIIGLTLLLLAARVFFSTGFEKKLLAFEEQGWFRAMAYKRSQGQKVRRGTMLGVLLLIGCGIFTLLNRGTLSSGDPDWRLGIPFAPAQILVRAPGDTGLPKDQFVDRNEFREANEALAGQVRIDNPGGSDLRPKQIVPRQELEAQLDKMKEEGKEDLPTTGTPTRATAGDTRYLASVTLLPDVKFTVPLLLSVGALWLAWRLVNFPVFADFLIATEAELNKVSWTTRKRLVQDTIVVLVTVVLFTVFLLCVDILWGKLLASRWIGVLRYDPNPAGQKEDEEVPW